ncbi:hypothetical protein PSAB6_390075 [Paraburkholderia sabiae]|nr:hypothetical protein PSAB6_390075 [Paraburkholderia sabiae]
MFCDEKIIRNAKYEVVQVTKKGGRREALQLIRLRIRRNPSISQRWICCGRRTMRSEKTVLRISRAVVVRVVSRDHRKIRFTLRGMPC